MAWLKIESSVARNRKFVLAGPAASWLWICGLAYCQEGLTDGFIPAEAIDYLGVKRAGQLAGCLVLAGLWDATEGGWRVHDYLKHNRSASDVGAIRQARAAGGSLGGRPKHNLANNLPAHMKVSEDKPSQKPRGSTPENPSTATATATATEAATETATAVPRARPQTLVQRRRLDAAFEYGRLYVPQRAHDDLVALRNNPNAEAELWAFYERVCEAWTTGRHKDDAPDPDMIRFWKARYAEEWKPTAAAGKSSYAGWTPRSVKA